MAMGRTFVGLGFSLFVCVANAGCGDACRPPAPLRCCQRTCVGDLPAEPECNESGWACPRDSVSSVDCPKDRFCVGPLPGPPRAEWVDGRSAAE